ncbi:MAG: hypothetical protein EOP84_32535 [Verrucomicrobiaceae bacterium]|nr:MAG: hypothetical protein EOP84_32535 [Verrucomicrobiaceae bacterium]
MTRNMQQSTFQGEERHSVPVALLFSFVALVVGSVTSWMVLFTPIELMAYKAVYLLIERNAVQTVIDGVSLLVGFASSMFVFRICRRNISRGIVFHTSFFTGFGLLSFSLWLVLSTLHPTPANEYAVTHDFAHHEAGVTAPLARLTVFVIYCWLIPVSLMILSFATVYDRRSYQHPGNLRSVTDRCREIHRPVRQNRT